MSRIGKAPITIPDGVKIDIGKNNEVVVKGPKGELYQKVDRDLTLKIEEGILTVERPTDQKRHRAIHGLYRALLANMVTGVLQGYKKELELVGVGYRAAAQGNVLELSVGFSHPIHVLLPAEVKVTAEMAKGKPPRVTLESIDKQLLGEVASKIRSIRKPEPYKGKGIKYAGEELRRKAGKTAAAAGAGV